MRGPQEFKGLVLFVRHYREKDKLIKVFTESYGKKMFLVKHANRKNNPIQSSIQPFTEATYVGQINDDGLSFINASKDVLIYKNIQTDIFKSAYATYILNLIDVAIEDGVYDPSLYGFAKKVLSLIDESYDPEIITNIFEIQLLNRFGLEFHWESCVICGENNGAFDFSDAYSGVLCEDHWYKDERRQHFTPKAVHFLRLFHKIRFDQIKSISLSQETKDELRKSIDYFYEEYVGVRLKSKKFIDDMKSWEDMLKTPKNKN